MKKVLSLTITPVAGILVGSLLGLLFLIRIFWEIFCLIGAEIKSKIHSVFKGHLRLPTLQNSVSLLLLILFSINLSAQTPEALKWQGVVRNDQLEVIANQAVSIKFSILEGSENGGPIYIETHQAMTNELGLLSFNLGKGTFLDGSFTAIPWGTKSYFLKVEIDVNGGQNYKSMGTSELFVTTGQSNMIWKSNNNDITYQNGNVGIKKSNPKFELDIEGTANANHFRATGDFASLRLINKDKSGDYRWEMSPHGDLYLYNEIAKKYRMYFNRNGNIGIGMNNPTRTLEVNGSIFSKKLITENIKISNNWPSLTFESFSGKKMYFEMPATGNLYLYDPSINKYRLYFDPNGNAGVGTTKPTAAWHVAGTTKTNILEIVGGADITERVSATEKVQPGELVIIDTSAPNHVKRSSKAYDKTVIGIVSGAGGVKPGMELKQEGLLDGNTSFAIAGRVYVKVTGKVKPGDLLTTSNVPGHAMVATKRKKAHGAIIGKALSQNNNGLALVLVNLQ